MSWPNGHSRPRRVKGSGETDPQGAVHMTFSLFTAAVWLYQIVVPPMLSPPAPLRLEPASVGIISGRFECGDDHVELDLETTRSTATVKRYAVDGRAASQAQLADWNGQLSAISL